MKIRPAKSLIAIAAIAVLAGGLLAASPAQAQEYSLFDKFSIGLGVSGLSFDTAIRVDALNIGGTEIDFEDTLGVSSDEFTPSLVFQWQPGRRHNIFGRWDAVERDGTEAVSTELRFGDLVIPVDATVTTAFDLDELLFGYNYYPWLRDRWALGFGLGFRWLDISTSTEITLLPQGTPVAVAQRETAAASAPMPFFNLDYRYGISPNWRLGANLGVFDIEIDDFNGSQTIVGAVAEHLAWKGFSWGFGGSFSAIDVDVNSSDWIGSAKVDVLRFGIFGKARW